MASATSSNKDPPDGEDPEMSTSAPGSESVRKNTVVDLKQTRISRLKRASTLDGETMPTSWKDRRLKARPKKAQGDTDGGATDEPEDADPFKTKGRLALSRSVTR